jgi:glutaredoxin 3
MLGGINMVKVYSITDCSWCKKTKNYLSSRGIEYEDINVEKDKEGRQELISLSKQQSVPVLNIDGNVVVGFDKEKIDEYLNLQN